MERDLFGRLIALSLQYKLDLGNALGYPLTPVPLSLCHADGTMHKTNKSTLLRQIEKLAEHDFPKVVDEKIIDGFHFIHKIVEFPPTFGGIAKLMLKKIERMKVKKVHLIFDNYISPSIKDLERLARAKGEHGKAAYHISGSKQMRPSNFLKALRSDEFKDSFVKFLVEEWSNNTYAAYFIAFSLYVTYKNDCYYYSTINNNISRNIVPSLYSSHLEADTRMIFHLSRVSCGNVVISSVDTDVVVILLGNMHNINSEVNVWMEIGSSSRNDLRFLNIRNLHEKLGPTLSRAIPAFHSLTGSDYTAAFYKLGKVNPFKILQESQEAQNVFASMQDEFDILENEKIQILEKYICSIYKKTKFSNIDELRLNMFLDTYKPKDFDKSSQPFKKMKGIEVSSIPPCRRVFLEKIKRSQYVTAMWSNLHRPNPPSLLPENFGWKLEEGIYKPFWYHGDCVPDTLGEILANEERKESADDEIDEAHDWSSEDESDEED